MYFKLALFALVCSSIVYCNENDIIKRWRETNPRFMQYPSCGTNTCPSSCGNSCGTINGLQACQCQPGSSLGSVCTLENIKMNGYYYPYPSDPSQFIQCDHLPGRYFIVSCKPGLLFDDLYKVCNYPYAIGKPLDFYDNQH